MKNIYMLLEVSTGDDILIDAYKDKEIANSNKNYLQECFENKKYIVKEWSLK